MNTEKNKAKDDSIALGVLFLAISIAFLLASLQYQPDSALMPKILSVTMAFLSALLIVQGAIKLFVFHKQGATQEKNTTTSATFRALFTKPFFICIVGVGVLAALMHYVGFLVASVVFCAAMMILLQSKKPLVSAIIFVALLGLIYLIFFYFLGVSYPEGVLWG